MFTSVFFQFLANKDGPIKGLDIVKLFLDKIIKELGIEEKYKSKSPGAVKIVQLDKEVMRVMAQLLEKQEKYDLLITVKPSFINNFIVDR